MSGELELLEVSFVEPWNCLLGRNGDGDFVIQAGRQRLGFVFGQIAELHRLSAAGAVPDLEARTMRNRIVRNGSTYLPGRSHELE